MKTILSVIFYVFLVGSATASTVPPFDFRLTVTWGLQNETYEDRDLGDNHLIDSGTGTEFSDTGFSIQSDAPYFDRVSETKISWFFGFGDFLEAYGEYDFVSRSGFIQSIDANLMASYVFGPSGGSYYYANDDDPYRIESADLVNVSATVERLTPVPLPASGLLLLGAFAVFLRVRRRGVA